MTSEKGNTPSVQGPFSPKTIWILRTVIVGLFIAWLSCMCYLHNQIQQDKAKLEQRRLEASRRQELMRRGAQYQQNLQQRSGLSRVRNVLDGR